MCWKKSRKDRFVQACLQAWRWRSVCVDVHRCETMLYAGLVLLSGKNTAPLTVRLQQTSMWHTMWKYCTARMSRQHKQQKLCHWCMLSCCTDPSCRYTAAILAEWFSQIFENQSDGILFHLLFWGGKKFGQKKAKAQWRTCVPGPNKSLPPTCPELSRLLALQLNTKKPHNSCLTNWPCWNNVSWLQTVGFQWMWGQESL